MSHRVSRGLRPAVPFLAGVLFLSGCARDHPTEARSPDLAFSHAGHAHGPPIPGEPVPIAGGIDVPPLIHVFAPGFPGGHDVDSEPNVITDFRGFTALAFLIGTATDAGGNTYEMLNDIRVFQGEYVASDGRHYRGTFAFI